ncbi:hypothetical protein BTA51_00325 [Hahella sp. CCB-MM4]|uniref:hypothetical protein n=1 Tax=Hahella sp. (strain CCB-MM4) TaxID=1926491 RepID=UPI000B9A902F|nr:hypothetical protein [Hahella sp. CCB-MM4]OZG74891.1 hypothetical protein BTA51_00325 [Hahella sp. CCB-MM4]
MNLARISSTSLTKFAFAVAVPLMMMGCEELENKPKTPLVIGDPFFLQGNTIGTESSLNRGDARISIGYTADTAASTFLDALEQDNKGEFIPYRGIEWRYQSAEQYYTEKNANYRLMMPNKSLKTFMTLNTQEVALGLFTPIGKLPESDTDTVTPPDLTDGNYTCIRLEDQRDGDGDLIEDGPMEVHSYSAQFVDADNLSMTKTTPGTGDPAKLFGYGFTRNKVLEVTDASSDGYWKGVFEPVIDNSCDKILLEDEFGTEYFQVPYLGGCPIEVKAFGGASSDGSVVHFSQVAYVERKINEDLFAGTCPDTDPGCGYPPNPVEPVSAIQPLNKAWKKRLNWNVCIRNTSGGMSNSKISGTYWMGTLYQDSIEGSLILSEYTADGAGSGINRQTLVTNDVALREERLDYNVDSDGELTINGRYGVVSSDGALFVYDASQPARDIAAITIGLLKYR